MFSYLYLAIKEQRTRHDTSEKQTKRMPKMLIGLFMKYHRVIQPMSLVLKDLFFQWVWKRGSIMGQRVSSPSLAERHLFQERPCKVFPLNEELKHMFFLFQAGFWRKLEIWQHGGWMGKDLQVQRRCKWGEFRVLSSNLSQPAHFKTQKITNIC